MKGDNGWIDLPTEPGHWWVTWGRWSRSDGWHRWSLPAVVHVTEVTGGLVLAGDRIIADKREEQSGCVWIMRFQRVEFPKSPWTPGDLDYRQGIETYPNAPGWSLK